MVVTNKARVSMTEQIKQINKCHQSDMTDTDSCQSYYAYRNFSYTSGTFMLGDIFGFEKIYIVWIHRYAKIYRWSLAFRKHI